eukprot:Mycagemm_TRINITY_DN9885_c0_g2::TRINITY_DN9885_c0_g2_i1::g.146::m.146 type:complete len:113 gc:universal TRINITY_DN9885_c0_g2_i1:1132-794(-)
MVSGLTPLAPALALPGLPAAPVVADSPRARVLENLLASMSVWFLPCGSSRWKWLWYEPGRKYEPSPARQHSNLSKMQSFSYKSQSLERRWSWMGITFTGLLSMFTSHTFSVR